MKPEEQSLLSLSLYLHSLIAADLTKYKNGYNSVHISDFDLKFGMVVAETDP